MTVTMMTVKMAMAKRTCGGGDEKLQRGLGSLHAAEGKMKTTDTETESEKETLTERETERERAGALSRPGRCDITSSE